MSAHPTHTRSEGLAPGIARDAVLRPVGTLMAVIGLIWALFAGMASEAGTYGQPLAAVGLIVLGLLVASAGKHSEQI
jgi:hypothetical protein